MKITGEKRHALEASASTGSQPVSRPGSRPFYQAIASLTAQGVA